MNYESAYNEVVRVLKQLNSDFIDDKRFMSARFEKDYKCPDQVVRDIIVVPCPTEFLTRFVYRWALVDTKTNKVLFITQMSAIKIIYGPNDEVSWGGRV